MSFAQGRLMAILVTFGSTGLLYLVARTAAVGLSPLAAAQLPPKDPTPLAKLEVYKSLIPKNSVSEEAIGLARRAALTAPLAFEPFFILGRKAEQDGRIGDAIRLMEEARARRPNFPATRLQLATYYGKTERLDDLLSELDIVLRLRPQAIEPVMAELTKLMSSPAGRGALATALVRQPHWREQFFSIARGRGATPAQSLALLNEVRKLNPNGDHRMEARLYMFSLVDSGEIARARHLWLATLPPAERLRHSLITNNGFRGKLVDSPFGWTFRSLDVGRAQLMGQNGAKPFLDVEYFGGSNAVLAEQAIALRPGAYQLRLLTKGEAGTGNAKIYWAVRCAADGPELARIETRASPDYQREEAKFNVPTSKCQGQHIRLIAEAGDAPGPLNFQFANLEITR